MPRQSRTGNVRKVCGCSKWKECGHPWYVEFKAPKRHPRRGVSTAHPTGQRFRQNLRPLIERHPQDFTEAREEARRAIVAWLAGRDPRDLQPNDRPTLAAVIDAYEKRPGATKAGRWQIAPITRTAIDGHPLGSWIFETITMQVIEQFQQSRPLVAGNRNLAYLRAVWNWAIKKGLTSQTPFRVLHVPVITLQPEQARTRRLREGEEEKLLLAATGRMVHLIVAAIETGCREGELLSLQWHQVRFSPKAELFLPAGRPRPRRTAESRSPPSSAPCLKPAGSTPQAIHSPRRPTSSGIKQIGRKVSDIGRAWETLNLKAHGHTPKWIKGKLTPSPDRP